MLSLIHTDPITGRANRCQALRIRSGGLLFQRPIRGSSNMLLAVLLRQPCSRAVAYIELKLRGEPTAPALRAGGVRSPRHPSDEEKTAQREGVYDRGAESERFG